MKHYFRNSLVSVVMPTYNNAQFISDAIESVLTQTYKQLELIIIDNFSEDNTKELVLSYDDPRIKYIKFKNNGIIAASRNIGIKHSAGEFIAFLDADDKWLPQKLERQVACLRANPEIALFYGLSKTFGLISTVTYLKSGFSGKIFYKLIESNFIPCLTVMVRSSVMQDVGRFDEDEEIKFAEDWELWLRIAYKYNIGFTPEVLGYYRVHKTGHSHDEHQIQRAIKVIDKIRKKGWISEKKFSSLKTQLRFSHALKTFQHGNKKILPELFRSAYKDFPTVSQKAKAFVSVLLALFPRLKEILIKWKFFHRKSSFLRYI
jgi:glycosyltransferase involved in cell wall biosynthesis